eukprot:jgi/Mesvir1/19617/Mv09911-RA.1
MPEVRFCQMDVRLKRNVVDGQQRLMSLRLFVEGKSPLELSRAVPDNSGWEKAGFTLCKLKHLPLLNGKSFQDLDEDQRQMILRARVKVETIPADWPLEQMLIYFSKIQGGGTVMKMQELRQALSFGEYTKLLNELVMHQEMREAMGTHVPAVHMKEQELLARFFLAQDIGVMNLKSRPLNSAILEDMRRRNKLPEARLKKQLKAMQSLALDALEVANKVFAKKDGALPFRSINKSTSEQGKIEAGLWDVHMHVFSGCEGQYKKEQLLKRAEELREALLQLTAHEAFESLAVKKVGARIDATNAAVRQVMEPEDEAKRGPRLFSRALKKKWLECMGPSALCLWCEKALGPNVDLLQCWGP